MSSAAQHEAPQGASNACEACHTEPATRADVPVCEHCTEVLAGFPDRRIQIGPLDI